jgi:hypothetical protein
VEEARQHPALKAPGRLAALLAMAAWPAAAGPELPSGLAVEPFDAAHEVTPDGTSQVVLRYLAPAIAGGAVPYEAVMADLDALCAAEGIAAAAAAGVPIDEIVIVLMDRPVPRGQPDPEATQYIAAYAPVDGVCEWL